MEQEGISSKDLIKLLGISKATLHRYLTKGYPDTRNKGGGVDPNMIPSWFVGGLRKWDLKVTKQLIEEAKR